MHAQRNQQFLTASLPYKKDKQTKNQNKKRYSYVVFLRVSQIFRASSIKTGFYKSQGIKIRRTDWSTPILIQLINAQPENNKGCPWHPLKNTHSKYHLFYQN